MQQRNDTLASFTLLHLFLFHENYYKLLIVLAIRKVEKLHVNRLQQLLWVSIQIFNFRFFFHQ